MRNLQRIAAIAVKIQTQVMRIVRKNVPSFSDTQISNINDFRF
jgi:hypothetical protein